MMKNIKNNEEFIVLKTHLQKLIKQNEFLTKENAALKKIIENLHSEKINGEKNA